VKGEKQNGKYASRTLEDSTYYDLKSWMGVRQPRLMIAMTEATSFMAILWRIARPKAYLDAL
jgi:hypothetical protein